MGPLRPWLDELDSLHKRMINSMQLTQWRQCWRARNLILNFLPGICKKLKNDVWGVGFDGLDLPWEVNVSWPLSSDGASFVLEGGGLPNQSSCSTCYSHHPRKALRHKFETCFASLFALFETISVSYCLLSHALAVALGIQIGLRISQFLWCILTGYTFWYLLWWSQWREFCVLFLTLAT